MAADSLLKVNVHDQFRPDETDIPAVARNLNAAFMIALSGISDDLYRQATDYFSGLRTDPAWGVTVRFYTEGLEAILSEISNRCDNDDGFRNCVADLFSWTEKPENLKNYQETVEKFHQVFFPEGLSLSDRQQREEKINSLRDKRKIRIDRLNPSPVTRPAKEILFTSNILVTTPQSPCEIRDLPVSDSLRQKLKNVIREDQVFWYDHPVPIGVSPEHNEVLYGLEALDEAVDFEKQRGTVGKSEKVTCVLSASATHKGLQAVIKEYLEEEFKKEKNIRNLDVFVFSEADTKRLVKDILIPAAERYLDVSRHSVLYDIVGVDGEYGRHYSFLKAISAFWKVLVAPEIKGTFKIDLDQVFPQKELVEQSGSSAFEHMMTPLWGAEGVDSRGNAVELGMIAGALVNERDINKGLFQPDVVFPDRELKADELIFFSALPQALSTEAEMMTRYTENKLDGKGHCIQRIHVTGGTCGILIEALRKYQPFTPTFIGRAEDQAYILSVLFGNERKNLRYVHKDGLIMRHDKEAFAGEAIKIAAKGKLIGDYIRILLFSNYVNSLPWQFEDVKDTIDPFTGCFVSKIPVTVVYLRFALKTALFFRDNTKNGNKEGYDFLQIGSKRLYEAVHNMSDPAESLIEKFQAEKKGWKLFYDILEITGEKLEQKDKFALELKKKAEALVRGCRINFEVK